LLTTVTAALFAIPAIKANIARLARPRKPKPAAAHRASAGQCLTWHAGRRAFA